MTNTKPDHDETLRQKLDRVADDEYYGPESQNKPIVDRVAALIPGADKILPVSKEQEHKDEQGQQEQTQTQQDGDGSSAPQRPTHDVQIEEFLRDQHRSNVDAKQGA